MLALHVMVLQGQTNIFVSKFYYLKLLPKQLPHMYNVLIMSVSLSVQPLVPL